MTEQRGRSRADNRLAHPRRGVVLVFFVLFVWVVMGIAALIIDQGAARLTQRQLQAAADGISLESMRDRDQARNPEELDDYFRDRRRRVRANRMSAWHFHPELVTGLGGEAGDSRGGGAFVDMRPGIGNLDGSAQVMAAGFSVPRLAANYAFDGQSAVPLNRRWGDVVSGAFLGFNNVPDPQGEPTPQGSVGADGNPFHVEDDKYIRTDFVPAEPEDAPYADAMVVRLRRTQSREAEAADTDPYGEPDHEDEGGVSTPGDTLPFLFGRGTTMIVNDEDGYSPRRDGQTIRGTAIGSSRPVVRVSPPLPEYDQDPDLINGFNIGCAPFVIHDLLWDWQVQGEVWTTEDGGRTWITYLTYENGFLWNVDSDSIPGGFLRPASLSRVGDKVLQLGGAAELWANEKNWEVEEAYAPVYARTAWQLGIGFSRRVIGFVRVRAELEVIPDPEGGPGFVRSMKVTKLGHDYAENPETPWIAPRNASAVFDGDQVSYLELQSDSGSVGGGWDWARMIRALNSLSRAIHAPVVVR